MSTSTQPRPTPKLRPAAWAWIAVCAAVVLLAVIVGLGGADRLVHGLDARWEARLAKGEALFEAGQFGPAAEVLERLNVEHPAPFVKVRFDRQHERVLELISRSHMALDRKRRATEFAERLVAFDPRNWNNHYLRATVASHFGETDTADEAYAQVLELYPSHLASVTGRITLAFESGDYAAVPPLFEAYLDAWRVAVLTISAGDQSAEVEVLADGEAHVVEALFERPIDPTELRIDPAGYAARVAGGAPRRTGQGGASLGTPFELALEPAGDGPVQTQRLSLSVTVYKALPAELWAMVEASYRNTLDRDRLAAAKQRILVGAPDAPLQLVD